MTQCWRELKIPIREGAHPLVRHFLAIANKRELSLREIGKKAGVSHQNLSLWAHRSHPRLDTFEAALNAIGYELVIRERRP